MDMSKLQSNIWKLYLIKAMRSFMLIIPVIVLFFQENGLSMKEIFLLQSLFSVTVIFLEIPTGYFSDIFGRKISIIIGGAIVSIGYFVYSMSAGFWEFLLAEIILGFGLSFVSGADTAMLYDTLAEMEKQSRYQKMEGRGQSFSLFSEGIASTIGGFLAIISLRFPLYCDTLVALMTVPIALMLVEPKRHKLKSDGGSLKNMYKIVKYSFHDHTEIKWLIIYSSIIGASTLTMVWFIQVYLAATNVPLKLFGVIWTVFLFTASIFSWNANSIEKKIGKKTSLIALIVIPVAAYFLLSSIMCIWSGFFILLFYITRGINNPVILSYVNGLVPSEIRATVLSAKNLAGRLIFSLVGPLVGWISDAFSLQAALTSTGFIFLFLGVTALMFMHRNRTL